MKTNKDRILDCDRTFVFDMMLGSAAMYIFNHAEVAKIFTSLGYPTYIIYPLAIAKILGVIAILTRYSNTYERMGLRGIFLRFRFGSYRHIMNAVATAVLSLPIIALVLFTCIKFLQKIIT